VKQLAILPQLIWDDGSTNERGWLGRKWNNKMVRRNCETTAVYHFPQLTTSLDSLEFVGGEVVLLWFSNVDRLPLKSLQFLFFNQIPRLILLFPSHFSNTNLSIFTNLQTLSLPLSEMKDRGTRFFAVKRRDFTSSILLV